MRGARAFALFELPARCRTRQPAWPPQRRRIWGWYFFDWASQPYNTLLLTFIFAPYFGDAACSDGTAAQAVWGYGNGAAGIVIALLSPLLGAIADETGGRMMFILLFSIIYVVGAWGLWWVAPGDFSIWWVMLLLRHSA